MTQVGYKLAISLLAIVGFLLASNNLAYGEANGRSWPNATTLFYTDDLLGASGLWKDAFEEAAKRWNDTATQFSLSTTRASGTGFCTSSGSNSAQFNDSLCGDEWGESTLAVAKQWWKLSSPETFAKVDIVFKSLENWSVYDGDQDIFFLDFRRVATHELGHAIGLGHSIDSNALLYAFYGNTYLPQLDDVNTLLSIYGSSTHTLTLNNNGSGHIIVRPLVDGTGVVDFSTNTLFTSNYENILDCNAPSCQLTIQDGLRLTIQSVAGNGESFGEWIGTPIQSEMVILAPIKSDRILTAVYSDTPSQNQPATIGIDGGNRTISDSDGVAGESVGFSATATDSDGTVVSTEWLVGAGVVATGLTANISLPDGVTEVIFRATDDDGAVTTTNVTVTIEAPNQPPIVSIAGGDREISDSDGSAGETVSFSATATDSDGTIVSAEWLTNNFVVATGLTANIGLADGETVVSFRATDDDGASSTDSVTITVEFPPPPNEPPVVSIAGGNRTITDTDGSAGENVSFSATVSDSDGTVVAREWLVDSVVVATGLTPNIALPNGDTTVTFRATDDDGASSTDSVTITVEPPNQPPVVSIADGNRNISDTDGFAGEQVSFSASVSDNDGASVSTEWIVDSAIVASGLTATIFLSDGDTIVTFRATDDDGASSTDSVTIAVEAPTSQNLPPVVSIIGANRTIADTDDASNELVSFWATATDSDGLIVSTEWLISDSVIATGLSTNIALPDGESIVTFRATDDDGESASTTVTVKVEPPPSEDGWPVPYSGITPDVSLGLELNNISALNPDDGLIFACINVLSNGVQSTHNGIEKYDIAFEVVDLGQAIIGVVKAKLFNDTGALNENGEYPDCSGSIEMTTNIYTDIIQAGTEVYRAKFELFDSINLYLRGLEIVLIGTIP